MHYGKLRQAFAAANLIDLGTPPHAAAGMARVWALKSRERTGGGIIRNMGQMNFQAPALLGAGLYLSFHYADYHLVYAALYRATQRPVFAVIGSQQPEQAEALETLAAAHDVEIRFIESGPSVVKKCRLAQKEGSAVVLLVDVPWARTAIAADTAYPCAAGAMLGHSTLDRLIALIDPRPHCLIVTRGDDAPSIIECRVESLADAYLLLDQYMRTNPVEYERLDTMHAFFRPDIPRSTLVCFTIGDNGFAVHPRSGGSWRLPAAEVRALDLESAAAAMRLRETFSAVSGHDIDAVITV